MVLNPNDGYNGTQLRKRLHWFNQTAFMAPSPSSFQVGNEKRNMIDGPGFNRMDVGVFRNFKLYRSMTLPVAWRGLQCLEPHQLGQPRNQCDHRLTFGTVTSTRDPRILQVAGKINF